MLHENGLCHKVCVITSIHPDFDGRIYKLVLALEEFGYHVRVICPWNLEKGVHSGVFFDTFPRIYGRWNRYKNYKEIWDRLDDSYDVFHFHDLDILPLFILFAVIRRKAIVFDIHENYVEEMKHKDYIPLFLRSFFAFGVDILEKIGLRTINNLVVVTEEQKKRYSERGHNVYLLRNFASKTLANSRKDDYEDRQRIVIFTGSQYESNGSSLFLDIAWETKKIDSSILFVGIDRFGTEQNKLQLLEKRNVLRLEDTVEYWPNVVPQNIMQYLNQARIGLILTADTPTHRYATPNKIFEYMAAGLPIVASRIPCNQDFVENHECGVLAQAGNAAEFARLIVELINDTARSSTLRSNSMRVFSEKYNWEQEIKGLPEYYEQSLAKVQKA